MDLINQEKMNMKKNHIILTCIFILAVMTQSCKYEEGPALSLRSKNSRAVNAWVIDQVFENGNDKTEEYKNTFVNYKAELKDDDTYIIQYRPFNISDYTEKGTWQFSDDKLKIEFTPENQKEGNPWKILRLKEHEAWIVQQINGKEVELRLKD